ncbi:MAG: hypothetical protein KatS3mg102_0240 [Planctomycetota bacterium]|nr:MAG: hypothetical protein KatS3mg102_0240 [Planctomycetota bacterium]
MLAQLSELVHQARAASLMPRLALVVVPAPERSSQPPDTAAEARRPGLAAGGTPPPGDAPTPAACRPPSPGSAGQHPATAVPDAFRRWLLQVERALEADVAAKGYTPEFAARLRALLHEAGAAVQALRAAVRPGVVRQGLLHRLQSGTVQLYRERFGGGGRPLRAA